MFEFQLTLQKVGRAPRVFVATGPIRDPKKVWFAKTSRGWAVPAVGEVLQHALVELPHRPLLLRTSRSGVLWFVDAKS